MVKTEANTLNEPVPLSFVRALLVQASNANLDASALLRQAGFPWNPLQQDAEPQVFISVEQYSRLCMALFQALNDESGGAVGDCKTPWGSTRLLLFSLLHCGNLRAAMERAIEFNASCRERRGEVRVHELVADTAARTVSLRYFSAADAQHPPRQSGALCGMAMWMRVCGWLTGQYIDIVSATCVGPEPGSLVPLRHFFHCPVEFDSDCNTVTFSARHLDAPLLRSEADVEEFLRVAPYHVVIRPIASEVSITTRIRSLLGDDLGGELPSFEELTGMLNMSPRTLRRRLEKEGTSYQRIKDNARRDIAISLLSRARMTVSDVAERVGFSDPSAFHRSFKKWTGQSPGEYR